MEYGKLIMVNLDLIRTMQVRILKISEVKNGGSFLMDGYPSNRQKMSSA